MMQKEIKSKSIIPNGFICISREQEEEDKNIVKLGNEIVAVWPASWGNFLFEYVAFSYLSHSLSECILVILIQLPCLSAVLRAAVWGLLVTMVYHVAGIYQVKELRNLDKSDMCEHDSASVCFLCLFLHLSTLSLFIQTQFPFSFFLFSPESAVEPERA